jgi:hypothetical protein
MKSQKFWISLIPIALVLCSGLAQENQLSIPSTKPAVMQLRPFTMGWGRFLDPEKIRWTEETDFTVVTWHGLASAKISYCSFVYELTNGSRYPEILRLIYVPATRHVFWGNNQGLSQTVSNCFVFREGLLVFQAWEFRGFFSTNQIPAGTEQGDFIQNLKQEYIQNYPASRSEFFQQKSIGQRLDRYFGEGRIIHDPVSGTERIMRAGPMGPGLPIILSIGTDGTNAVVAYDSLPALSEDRPVLTLDSDFRVVRAELNGQPLILNRTNNIYVRREEDRQRAEGAAPPN